MRRCRVLLVLLVLGCPSIAVDDDDASEDDEAVGDDDTGDDDTGDDDTGDDDSGDDDSGDDDSGDDDDSEPCWSGSDPVALFDMAAIAIVKNPAWADRVEMGAPKFADGKWTDRPDNPRRIVIWENFDKDAILKDFYTRMSEYVLITP